MDELSIETEFCNEDILSAALEHEDSSKKVVIVNYRVQPAVPKGKNYCSIVFRVHVEFKEQNSDVIKRKSLIFKCPIYNNVMSECLEELQTVDKENTVYKMVIPKMYRLLDIKPFAPHVYFSSKHDVIILEDLDESGYIVWDKLKLYDYKHSTGIIRILAKFHAASVVIIKQNEDLVEKIGKELYYTSDSNRGFILSTIEGLASAVETWPGYERFGQKLRSKVNTIWDELQDVFKPCTNSLNILNHGDIWVSNIFFKYNEDRTIDDIKIIDYQFCLYCTPAIDIQKFLVCNANEYVRENKINEICTEYLEVLNSTFEELNCSERLSQEQLEFEMRRTDCYGLVMMAFILGCIFADPEDPVDFSEMNGEILGPTDVHKNPIIKSFYGKYYQQIAPNLLLHFEKTGYL